ncbi:hypothetical protein PAAL109150_06610 [Paenibacillus alkaliterrae]
MRNHYHFNSSVVMINRSNMNNVIHPRVISL